MEPDPLLDFGLGYLLPVHLLHIEQMRQQYIFGYWPEDPYVSNEV